MKRPDPDEWFYALVLLVYLVIVIVGILWFYKI